MNLPNLLESKWVRKLINLTQKEDKLFSSINLDFVDNLFEKLKEKQKQSKEEIEQLYNVLMQKAFNGELVR